MTNKIAIVTGATKGIGLAIARQLESDGYRVYGTYVRDYEPDYVARLETPTFKLHQVDARNLEACDAFIKTVQTEQGRIDVLVNNAGIVKDNLMMRMQATDFTDVVDVESLLGCSLADYGVYKYTSSQGKIAVVVRKYYKDIAYDDNSKHFENEDAFKAWSDEMMADDHYGDASIVSRAIEDIEGEN